VLVFALVLAMAKLRSAKTVDENFFVARGRRAVAGSASMNKLSILILTALLIAPLADHKQVFFLDVGDKLIEPDGSISPAVMPDKLHVAGPGYTRWMEAMGPALDKLLNEHPGLKTPP